MDFLSLFPSEISDLILGELYSEDMLNASLVSKHWYNYIANSKRCMKSVAIYYKGKLDQDINPLLNSCRQYQYMRFICDENEFIKHRRIENIFRLILNKFSDSIVSLQTSHDTKRVSLKKLMFFSMSYRRYAVIYPNGILSTSKIIERLVIKCQLENKSIEVMKKLLQNMTELKILGGTFYYFMPNWQDWFNHQFSLKEVTNYPPRTYINEFLLEHRSTIEKVRIKSTENLEFMLTSFPRLHTIVIESLTTELSHDFPFNETVTTLIISNPPEQSLDYTIIRILSKLKNLKVIKLFLITFEVLLAIYSLRSTLKTFFFVKTEDTEFMRFGLSVLANHMNVRQLLYNV
ncbi:unnamed protein product [Chironomus riparius]|uniref:F-box domain-containing protein n=1 Tax=Chironomus riparius TaxID=315576 RepID=A0A9N9RIV2_9DIPT|nr:unnamed protein product [Chironomus riparius]